MLKTSERLALKKVLPWVAFHINRGSPSFTLTSIGNMHYSHLDPKYLAPLDNFYNGKYAIVGCRLTEAENMDWLCFAPDPQAAWNEFCNATNFLLPIMTRANLDKAPHLVAMQANVMATMTMEDMKASNPGMEFKPFEWEPKHELSDIEEYNEFFKGSVLLNRKPN